MQTTKLLYIAKRHHLVYLFIKWFIVPIALVVFGLILSVFLNSLSSKDSISIISYPNAQGDKIVPIGKSLMQGQTINAEFVAQSNNLGILAIRFGTYKRAGSDIIIFRIKENSEKEWYYQTNYKVDQFQDNQLFTFGFPVIVNSKGKIYKFQIESTLGKKGDAVYVSSSEPIFVTKYKYSIKYAIHNIADTINFIGKKAIIPSPNLKDSFQYLLLLTPLIFYVFLALFNRKLRAKVYYGCLLLLSIIMTFSSGFNSLQDLRIIGIIWILGIFINQLKSEVTFLVAGVMVCLSSGAFISGNHYLSEKITFLVYWLLLIAVIELMLEIITRKRFEIGYKELLKMLL